MPLRFMYVSGLANTTSLPAMRVLAVNARQRRLVTPTPPCSASRSMARKPTLCGVNWYSMPGLPSPTTRARPLCTWASSRTRAPSSAVKLRTLLLGALFGGRLRSVRLALLGHFWFRRSRSNDRIDRRCNLLLNRHYVCYSCALIGDELELAVRQIGHADGTVQPETAHIQVNMAGDIARQALDLHLAQYLVENAALHFDANRNSLQQYGHLHPHRLVHSDTLQVDVHQLALDGLVLPIDDHGLGAAGADFQIKNRVVARIRMQNAGNLLGVYFHRNRGFLGAVEDAWNHSGDAYPAGRILIEFALASLRCNYFLLSHTFLPLA